jgi:hypothetical protein
MFETQYGKSLDEETFDAWLEKGRSSNLGYHFLIVIWNTLEEEYLPTFAASRDDLAQFQTHHGGHEIVVAIYDLYSESRVSWEG